MTLRGAAAALLLAAWFAPPAQAQSAAPARQLPRELPGSVALGPRLLDYPIDCTDPRGCRIECFQHGVKVISRTGIGQQDEVRLIASAGVSDEVIPRWIEIRPFSGSDVQTLLLTTDTFCDLKSLVLSPQPRP
jgi:hypothetical protein